MPHRAHMGSRIRQRRTDLGLKQADLAERIGISAPYLNLIEHERRRIGGRLLLALARELKVEVSALAEGAEAGLVAALGAAAREGRAQAEEARAADFAARFPGWAALVAAQHRRIRRLEETVETLSDRLTHDPRLASALHEVLSVVTAVRATAAILSDTGDLDREWLDRFHRNLDEDSRRLAGSAEALVAYLDGGGAPAAVTAASPQEEFETWLAARGGHLPEAEAGEAPSDLPSGVEARALALDHAAQAAADAGRMPAAAVAARLADGVDPAVLAAGFGVPLTAAFRRIAALPPGAIPGGPYGLIRCDAAGAVTFRQLAAGFQMPRLGAACPLWPLYQALSRPVQPIAALIEQASRLPQRFVAWAVAEPAAPPGFGAAPTFAAAMLFRAATPDDGGPAQPVGTTCRVCPRAGCPARREPSVLPGA